LPENFDRPYLARNVPDFWNRWHISLTHWIRDYVFMTSYKAAAERFPAWGKYLGWALLFLSLLLAGMWHGSTAGFMVFGALNGLGAVAAQVYGELLKKLLGRNGFQAYMRSRFVRTVAIVLTLSFEAFSLVFFSSGIKKALDLLRTAVTGSEWQLLQTVSLPAAALKLALIAGPIAVLVLLGIWWKRRALVDFVVATSERLRTSVAALYAIVICKTAIVTVALLVCWAISQGDPVVVYMRF
jgi:D-alanyl-lipoteichoic acid acyltransferase DltB (MBOAT superfamily)